MSVRRAQAEISADEFVEWLAVMRMDPMGEQRGDLRAAIVASTVANASPNRARRQVFRVKEFMPDFGAAIGQDWRTARALIKQQLKQHNARLQRGS